MPISENASAIRVKNSGANTSGTTTATDTTVAAGSNGALLLIVTSLTSVSLSSADITEGGASANTWTSLFTAPAGGSWTIRAWIATNPNTHASHTVSVSKTGAYPAIALIPISGILASGAADVAYATFFGSGSTSFNAKNVLPSQGGELVVWALGGGVAAITGPGGTITKQAEAAGDGLNKGGISIFTEVQPNGSIRNGNDTFTFSSQQGAVAQLTFRPATAGVGGARIQPVAGGTGGTATNPANVNFERTQPYTAWCTFFKYTDPGNPAVLYTNVGAGGAYPGHELFIGAGANGGATGKLVIRMISNFATNNYIEVNGSTTVTDGKWRQVIVRYDGSSTAAGFSIALNDGSGWVAETMTTVRDTLSASIVAAGQNLQLGWQNGFAFDMSQSGTGAVARLVLENVRRDDAYLTANSNLWAMPPNDANSLGRWQCYEATGTTVSDSGPNGYNVTLASATWWAGDAGSGNDLAPATTLINKECPRAAAGRFGYFAGRVSPFARF